MDDSHYRPPHSLDSTSSRLLLRLRERDPEAWRYCVRLYGPVVRYWIRRARLGETDMADVFQEVFLAVSRKVGHFDRDIGQAKFRAWLRTITQSKINDHFRRQAKQPELAGGTAMMKELAELHSDNHPSIPSSDDDPALAGSESLFIAQRTLQMIKEEFQEKTWRAFYRMVIDGQTSQAVAEELGMKADAVRRAKFRILKRLRKELGTDADSDASSTPDEDVR